MQKLEIVYLPVDALTPYERNARKHSEHDIQAIKESIRQSGGFNDPIGIWGGGNLIVEGHGRLMAAKELGMKEVPCIRLDHMTEEERRKYAILHNRTAEMSEWETEILNMELGELDFGDFDFEFDLDGDDGVDMHTPEPEDHSKDFDRYSTNVKIPQYEPTGRQVTFDEMVDCKKTDTLIDHINKSHVSDAEKDFLIKAAQRHNVFTYKNIAEYYANATPEMQRLMEESALVIIDIKDAIANGYAILTKRLNNLVSDGDEFAF